MSINRETALSWLLLALVFVSGGCEQKQPRTEPGPGNKYGLAKRAFRIYIYADPNHGDQCLVDWPQALLWKSSHQTVTWVSDDKAAYTVDFTLGKKGSPFVAQTFAVPANGEVASGDLVGAPDYYDYGIRAANNNICKQASNPDPGVYVK